MLVVGLGALLLVSGILYMAAQAIRRGRLSGKSRPSAGTGATLEPRERGGGFAFGTNWPGFLLVAIGAALLLASALS